MKKKFIIGASVLGFVTLCLVQLYSTITALNSSDTYKVDKYTIPSMEKVFINGKIVPEESKDIYLDLTKGSIKSVAVKEGQSVKKGEILFTYKSNEIQDQIEECTRQLELMKNQKKELSNEQEKLMTQSIELEQSSNAELNFNIDNQINNYKNKINALKEKEYTTILAPIDGIIILHDNVKDGTSPYITIESPSFYVKGSVTEKEQPKLKKDQVVDITILSTNETIKGRIDLIGNRPIDQSSVATDMSKTSTSDITYYEVKIKLESQDNLTNGFHVQAVHKLTEEFVRIPKSAILKDGETYYVYKIINNTLRRQIITCLEYEANETIKVTGLSENDEIVENPNSDMKEGESIE